MSVNSDFKLKSGEIFITENSDDAFIVNSGKLEVYIVSYVDGEIGRRTFLYEASENETIPGFCYTDMNYVNRRFLFVSQGVVKIKVIRYGATKKLKSVFLSKIGINNSHEQNFNEIVADIVRVSRVTEDNFITRSQILRENTGEEIDTLINKESKKRLEFSASHIRHNFKSATQAFGLMSRCIENFSFKQIFSLIGLTLLSSLLIFAFPYYLISAFDNGTENKTLLTVLVILSLLICGIASYFSAVIVTDTAAQLSQKMQSSIYKKIFSLHNSFFKNFETSWIAHMMLRIETVASVVVKNVYAFFCCLLLSFLCVCAVMALSPALAILGIILFILILLIYLLMVFRNSSIRSLKKSDKEKSSSLIYQFVSEIIKIRLSGAEERVLLEYLKPFVNKEKADEEISKRKNFIDSFFALFSVNVLVFVSTISILFLETETIGRMIAFVCVYVGFVLLAIKCVDAFIKIMDIQQDINLTHNVLEKYDTFNNSQMYAPEISGDVSLENVSFAYDCDDKMILDNISLHIEKGEYVAIVGESGSGKSTLLKLLLGFEKAVGGCVFFDGYEIKDIDEKHLRKHIGTVLQDGKLISATIQDNITITKPDAEKKEIHNIVRLVGLEDDLKTMPMGLQTMLSEGSDIISGGQRQKILIARALLHKPKILLFDEATSALDNESQKVIVDALDKLDVTRIVVAHRLSTITGCDRIIVLNNGTIAEEGTYKQLMDKRGLFYSMAKRQII